MKYRNLKQQLEDGEAPFSAPVPYQTIEFEYEPAIRFVVLPNDYIAWQWVDRPDSGWQTGPKREFLELLANVDQQDNAQMQRRKKAVTADIFKNPAEWQRQNLEFEAAERKRADDENTQTPPAGSDQ